jgi:hypothetical protein
VRASLLASERCEAAKTRLAEDESSRGDSIAEVDSE